MPGLVLVVVLVGAAAGVVWSTPSAMPYVVALAAGVALWCWLLSRLRKPERRGKPREVAAAAAAWDGYAGSEPMHAGFNRAGGHDGHGSTPSADGGHEGSHGAGGSSGGAGASGAHGGSAAGDAGAGGGDGGGGDGGGGGGDGGGGDGGS